MYSAIIDNSQKNINFILVEEWPSLNIWNEVIKKIFAISIIMILVIDIRYTIRSHLAVDFKTYKMICLIWVFI